MSEDVVPYTVPGSAQAMSYEFKRADGVLVKTMLANGQAMECREWPGLRRLEYCEPRPALPHEQALLDACSSRRATGSFTPA